MTTRIFQRSSLEKIAEQSFFGAWPNNSKWVTTTPLSPPNPSIARHSALMHHAYRVCSVFPLIYQEYLESGSYTACVFHEFFACANASSVAMWVSTTIREYVVPKTKRPRCFAIFVSTQDCIHALIFLLKVPCKCFVTLALFFGNFGSKWLDHFASFSRLMAT